MQQMLAVDAASEVADLKQALICLAERPQRGFGERVEAALVDSGLAVRAGGLLRITDLGKASVRAMAVRK